ncbi:MAG: hypothetical protein RL637_1826 [Pseudomonadota bacterium]|jgi:acetate kinase
MSSQYILVLNAGSSSIKYALFAIPESRRLLWGMIERIGEGLSSHQYHYQTDQGQQSQQYSQPLADHQQAFHSLKTILECVGFSFSQIAAIGHRVVHGGESFTEPCIITDKVIHEIRNLIPLAPLHNPANLLGIELAQQLAPDAQQIAIFDTAFHQTLPDYAYHYAVPIEWYRELQLRRYGFHGTSHRYLAQQAALLLNKPLINLNLISLHLGNGASACAIQQGKSIDTSMGLTPLEGLMMGTRSGDIDPAIYPYLNRIKGWSIETINQWLNHHSGLKGIAASNDMRMIARFAALGHPQAQLARQIFAYRIKKIIGSYLAIMNAPVDAIIFSGGIGEHDADLRLLCCESLIHLGIAIDKNKNQSPATFNGRIHIESNPLAILVIPTDEELAIVLDCQQLLLAQSN